MVCCLLNLTKTIISQNKFLNKFNFIEINVIRNKKNLVMGVM